MMDRISQLPESIVHHHILSSFKTEELVRMSVLSKNWFHLTASFPVLYFSIDDFTNVSRESFFKYVEYTTSRFCHQNVSAHKLKLVTTLGKPAETDIVNRCIELVLKNGVRKLVIDISNFPGVQKYRLPNILLSVSVLKSLIISGCELPSSLMVDAVKFKSLIRLVLEFVTIDDEVIKCFTTSCPLLEVFQIIDCHGLKVFCVHGHKNLQKVWIINKTQLDSIDIEAPNLSTIFIADRDGRGEPQMNLASCKKLTTVAYYWEPLPNSNGITDFLSSFPYIENLFLVCRCKGNILKLSSYSLKTLVLHSSCDLEDIECRTPNLDLFVYSHDYQLMLQIFFSEDIRMTHLKACMRCYLNCVIDAVWFQKLRLFLDKKNGFKVLNLCIHTIHSLEFKELGKLKVIELPPYELDHVELQLDTDEDEESSSRVALVDAVLWCCRPRSLTLRSSFSLIDCEDLVKFTSEKLLQQENQGHTKIKIVSPSSEAQKHLKGLNTISFIKKRI